MVHKLSYQLIDFLSAGKLNLSRLSPSSCEPPCQNASLREEEHLASTRASASCWILLLQTIQHLHSAPRHLQSSSECISIGALLQTPKLVTCSLVILTRSRTCRLWHDIDVLLR